MALASCVESVGRLDPDASARVDSADPVGDTGTAIDAQVGVDAAPAPFTPWPEEVAATLTNLDAPYDLIELAFATDGTTWLAFRDCLGSAHCETGRLMLAHRSAVASPWQSEDVDGPFVGPFAMALADGAAPVLAYEEFDTFSIRGAARTADGMFDRHTFAIPGVGSGDSVAMVSTGVAPYLALGTGRSDMPVGLFRYESGAWEALHGLSPAAGDFFALLPRALALAADGSLFAAVRVSGITTVGVAAYAPLADSWSALETLPFEMANYADSLISRADGERCFSGLDPDYKLAIACRDAASGNWRTTVMPNEQVFGLPVMVETPDGGLHAIYDHWSNQELRIATRRDDGGWNIRVLHHGSAYAIAAVVDRGGRIVIAFDACDRDGNCELTLATEPG